jgi:hypothetical protein
VFLFRSGEGRPSLLQQLLCVWWFLFTLLLLLLLPACLPACLGCLVASVAQSKVVYHAKEIANPPVPVCQPTSASEGGLGRRHGRAEEDIQHLIALLVTPGCFHDSARSCKF